MKKIKVRAGGRLSFEVERADATAISATFIAQDGTNIIQDTVSYDDNGEAYFEFNSPDTDVIGTYKWQVNENFESGSPDIYPNGNCTNCELPTLEICESLPEGS